MVNRPRISDYGPGFLQSSSVQKTSQLQTQGSTSNWMMTDLFHQSVPPPSNQPSQAPSFQMPSNSSISLDGLDQSTYAANNMEHVKNYQPNLNNEFCENVNGEVNYDCYVANGSVVVQPPPESIFVQPPHESIFDQLPPESVVVQPPSEAVKIEAQEYRQVQPADYHFGYNVFGKEDARLIVFEENSRILCRQYFSNGSRWYCTRGYCRSRVHGYVENGIFYAPIGHKCNAISYSEVSKKQDNIKKKLFQKKPNTRASDRLNQVVNHVLSLSTSFPAISPPKDLNVTRKRSSLPNPEAAPESKKLCKEPSLIEATINSPSIENGSVTISFNNPSKVWFKAACIKLGLPFEHSAFLFYAGIAIDQISLASKPHETKYNLYGEDGGFRAISLLLCGKEDDFMNVKQKIAQYFANNFQSLGNINGIDYASMTFADPAFSNFMVSNQMTPVHWESVTKILQCRIGIFQNDGLKKYGKWNEDDDDMVSLLFKFDGSYHIVTSLI